MAYAKKIIILILSPEIEFNETHGLTRTHNTLINVSPCIIYILLNSQVHTLTSEYFIYFIRTLQNSYIQYSIF